MQNHKIFCFFDMGEKAAQAFIITIMPILPFNVHILLGYDFNGKRQTARYNKRGEVGKKITIYSNF